MSIYMAYMIVFACWFGLRMIGYGAEILFMKEKIKSEVIEEPTADPYSCPLFEVRLLENKLVDAGIIKEHEMSICGSDECDDCKVTSTLLDIHTHNELRTKHGFKAQGYCIEVDKILETSIIRPAGLKLETIKR